MNIEKKKQLSVGIVFSYLAIAAKLLSGIVYTPIILHSLGQSEYGIYSLCLSFTGYLTIFTGGMNAAYVRYYVQTKENGNERIEKINGIFLKIFLVLGITGAICGIMAAMNAEYVFGSKILPDEYDILKKSLYVLAFTVLFSSSNGIFSSAIIANEKFVVGKLVELLNTIIVPVITIPFLISGSGSVIILEINLVASIFVFVFDAVYAIKKLRLKIEFGKTDKILLTSIITFASFIAIQGIMDQLNWQIDKYILARFKGAEEVAVYSVGSLFNSYFITITSAISGVFITEINRLVANGKNTELSSLFVKTSRIFAQVSFFVMSAYIIFGRQFIFRWSGVGYDKSFYVGLLIMLPVTVSLSQGLGQDIARAKNLHRIQITINIFVCILNFIVSIPLAKLYGAIGSAFGTFVCEIIICIIVQSIYYHRSVKINMKAYYIEMCHLLPGWIIPLLFGFAINYLGWVKNNYGSILLFGGIYMMLYLLSIWMFSLSPSEKGMIKKVYDKITMKR